MFVNVRIQDAANGSKQCGFCCLVPLVRHQRQEHLGRKENGETDERVVRSRENRHQEKIKHATKHNGHHAQVDSKQENGLEFGEREFDGSRLCVE